MVRGKIPYIIIPRGELTKQAQARKCIKKKFANILLCSRYARNAAAIQYLTEQEWKDSGLKWNKNHVIISNGIDVPKQKKTTFTENGIRCVSIGRIEPYQKGLDMLIEACAQLKDELTQANCTIDIYGPDREGKKTKLEDAVREHNLDKIIRFFDGVYGEEKERVLLEHDVFIMPSRFEGHPMALIEALAYGLPCLVTTGSNMRNEVEEFYAGWGADNEKAAIIEALKKILSCKYDEYIVKSENAYSLAKKFSWDDIGSKSHDYFLELIRKKNSAR